MQLEVQSVFLYVNQNRVLNDWRNEDWIHAEWEFSREQLLLHGLWFVVFTALFVKIKIFRPRSEVNW